MTIYAIFTLCGGLAFFLFGMNLMSGNLKKVAGGKMQGTLERLTSNRFKGLLIGAIITIAIQSSSALTVMLVGLVNSGLMQLNQTIALIMGSNIGTTLTSWILSLNGIESSNLIISMLKPENFAPIVALIGVVMVLASKSSRRRDLGTIFCGFAILMYGMTMMSDAVKPIASQPGFQKALVAFSNPFVALLVGVAFTGVIQSSAASIGVLQALALTGNISFGMAIPLVMGANIGTCVTALLSAIGVSRRARRVSLIHIWLNIIGAAIFMTLYLILRYALGMPIFEEAISSFEIAVFHSIFNVGTVILLLPFTNALVRLIERILPLRPDEGRSDRPAELLDHRLLVNPPVALDQCFEKSVEMAKIAAEAFTASMSNVLEYNPSADEKILEQEDYLDYMEDQLDTFLIRLSAQELTDEDSNSISKMLHSINDFERISDHAANMVQVAQMISENKLTFSNAAVSELRVLQSAVDQILNLMASVFENDDEFSARHAGPLREVINHLVKEIKNRHIDRLQTGECSGEMGVVLNDILTHCDRAADLSSNICLSIIQLKSSSFEVHSFSEELRTSNDPQLELEYAGLAAQYALAPYTPLKVKKKKKKKDKDKEKEKSKEKNKSARPEAAEHGEPEADQSLTLAADESRSDLPASSDQNYEETGSETDRGEKERKKLIEEANCHGESLLGKDAGKKASEKGAEKKASEKAEKPHKKKDSEKAKDRLKTKARTKDAGSEKKHSGKKTRGKGKDDREQD
jgi:phosphate:Na+ symporter